MTSSNAIVATTIIPTAELTPEQRILAKLEILDAKLDDLNEKLEAIEVRLSDMDLDSGSGLEVEVY